MRVVKYFVLIDFRLDLSLTEYDKAVKSNRTHRSSHSLFHQSNIWLHVGSDISRFKS